MSNPANFFVITSNMSTKWLFNYLFLKLKYAFFPLKGLFLFKGHVDVLIKNTYVIIFKFL